MNDLPRITKRELTRVGIELTFEDNVRDWMRRGWCELEMYLWGNEQVRHWLTQNSQVIERRFEEDGA